MLEFFNFSLYFDETRILLTIRIRQSSWNIAQNVCGEISICNCEKYVTTQMKRKRNVKQQKIDFISIQIEYLANVFEKEQSKP